MSTGENVAVAASGAVVAAGPTAGTTRWEGDVRAVNRDSPLPVYGIGTVTAGRPAMMAQPIGGHRGTQGARDALSYS